MLNKMDSRHLFVRRSAQFMPLNDKICSEHQTGRINKSSIFNIQTCPGSTIQSSALQKALHKSVSQRGRTFKRKYLNAPDINVSASFDLSNFYPCARFNRSRVRRAKRSAKCTEFIKQLITR